MFLIPKKKESPLAKVGLLSLRGGGGGFFGKNLDLSHNSKGM